MRAPARVFFEQGEASAIADLLDGLALAEITFVPPKSRPPDTDAAAPQPAARLAKLVRGRLRATPMNEAVSIVSDEAVEILRLLDAASAKGILCLTEADWEIDVREPSVAADPYAELLFRRLSPRLGRGDLVVLAAGPADRAASQFGVVAAIELSPIEGWTVWVDWPSRGVEGHSLVELEVVAG